MKKIVSILMLLLYLVHTASAQDFEPGQQAKGLLESKNVTVDYATGIFHYQVPLYTLKSGDYELPVTLDYVGKGVKIDEPSGLAGYNWTLNTGGVVTRTVRGGIPDEMPIYGFLWTENSPTPLWNEVMKVNNRLRDGECDIFTAVIGGISVNFIIRKDEKNHIYAEPLEMTNVKIQCLQEPGMPDDMIAGWMITDEAGNRLVYRQKEYTRDLSLENAITANGVSNENYVSSWYLSEIKPLNGRAIRFLYRPEEWTNREQNYLCETRYNLSYASSYTYGRAMREFPFDFKKYEGRFIKALDDAAKYVEYHAEEVLKSAEYTTFTWAHGWVNNPIRDRKMTEYGQHRRILGTLSSLDAVGSASVQLANYLDNLYRYYSSLSGMNAVYAAGSFAEARKCVIDCLNEEVYTSTKVVGNFVYYKILSPILERIVAPDSEMEFRYEGTLDRLRIASVSLYHHADRKRSSQVVFDNGADTLEKLSFINRDSVTDRDIRFAYYKEYPSEKSLCEDPWGYAAAYSSPETERFILDSDPVYSKYLSLKTITTPDKASIHLDYEPNRIFKTVYYDNDSTVLKLRYGGIRLSSIMLRSEEGLATDTISYLYPVSGTLVYDDYYNSETLRYEGFSDQVLTSKVKYNGVAFLNTGNNGMFYKQVIEHVSGKGSTSYLFHVQNVVNSYRLPYAFWMNALPLATAVYDEQGNLKRLKKNIYYADMKNAGVMMGMVRADDKEFFMPSDSLARYTKQIPQLQCYEYYMDSEKLDKEYAAMPFIDLGERGISPYNDIYLYNIRPRTKIVIPNRAYYLFYGGTTLLKEQREYFFEGRVTDCISMDDFYRTELGVPYKKEEFHYDDLKHSVTAPTRIVQTDRNGDTRVSFQRSVGGMEVGEEAVWKKMKEMNVLSPVVKSGTLKNGYLMEESVSLYDFLTTDTDSTIVLSEQYTYCPESSLRYEDNDRAFSYDPSLYTQTLKQRYGYGKGFYHPTDILQRIDRTARVYSKVLQRVILEARNVRPESVSASDKPRLENSSTLVSPENSDYLFFVAQKFWDGYVLLDKEAYGTDFLAYTKTEAHARIIRLIEILATHDPDVDMGEVRCALDCVKNQSDYVDEFMSEYMPVISKDTHFQLPGHVFMNWIRMFRNSSAVNPELFEYAYRQGNGELSVVSPEQQEWHVALSGYQGALSCLVDCEQGIVKRTLEPATCSSFLLTSYHLDLSSYSQVRSVKIEPPLGTDYGMLVPEGTEYEATCYNADGTVCLRFDHTGELELYEYDASGKILCVKDRLGNILKEYEYNHLINQ